MSSAILNRFSLAVFHSFTKKTCLHIRPLKQNFSTNSIFFNVKPFKEPTTYNIRRTWSRADTEKLLMLVNKYGNKWKVFANYFQGRTSFCIRAHYFSVTHDTTRWTLEEKKILQQSLGSKDLDPEKIDWEAIQSSLPKRRTIARIKQFWQNSIHPTLNRGSWTPTETQCLIKLVSDHGKDWEKISKQIKTRSEDQCRNKWAYEISTLKKGNVFFNIC